MEKRFSPLSYNNWRGFTLPSHSDKLVILILIRVHEGLQHASTQEEAQCYLTIIRKNHLSKERKEHPHNGGHAQATTNYLKNP